jgi:hypothetical protein
LDPDFIEIARSLEFKFLGLGGKNTEQFMTIKDSQVLAVMRTGLIKVVVTDCSDRDVLAALYNSGAALLCMPTSAQ